jgi:hypothetical protein
VGERLAAELIRVTRSTDDLEPCLQEQPRDSLTHQNIVLGDQDAYRL